MTDSDDTPARDAATVIPLRDRPDGLEVFMVRRHADSGFMADRYVYPGGQVDPADCTPRAARHTEGLSPEAAGRRLGDLDPMRALGLYLAGVRETFEEAGLLLSRRRNQSSFVDLVTDSATREAFEQARRQLAGGQLALTELADRRDLVVPVDRLGFFAHWITPYAKSRRYDTYFFAVDAPKRQAPLHDARETTDSLWAPPSEILGANRDGDLQLAPPTLRTLRRLDGFETVDAALASTADFDPPTQLPHMELTGDSVTLYLPGDPEYPADDPAYERGEPFEGWPTRMEAKAEGRWET